MKNVIVKKLSSNDVGDTGTHQAGMLIPKNPTVLEFFPDIGTKTKNPRSAIIFKDTLHGSLWEFHFIYYNGKLFGGTRNEFRLTRMTQFLKSSSAKAGDEIEFQKDDNGSYLITLKRTKEKVELTEGKVLVLSGGWKIIKR